MQHAPLTPAQVRILNSLTTAHAFIQYDRRTGPWLWIQADTPTSGTVRDLHPRRGEFIVRIVSYGLQRKEVDALKRLAFLKAGREPRTYVLSKRGLTALIMYNAGAVRDAHARVLQANREARAS